MTTRETAAPEGLVEQAAITADEDAARRSRFPVGAQVAFDDLEVAGREHVLDALREAEPVSWVPALGGWLVTGRDEAREVLAPRARTTVEARENLVRASLGSMMLTVDGDEHTRLRKPFEAPFKVSAVHDLFAATISDEADALLDQVPTSELELGRDFAAPLAVGMAGRMLGLSLGETQRIDGFYSAFAGAMVYDGDPAPQRLADGARAELDALLHHELDRTRREPDASLTSLVARVPDGLDDDEIVAQLRVIMFGAIETIQASIMNTLLLLLQHPDQLAAARGEQAVLAGAVEEALRLIPPVAFVERWTRVPVRVGEVEIPHAEFIGVSVLAANRDPGTFPEPLRFDARRSNAIRALSFSFGIHACVGIHLARLETTIALERLLTRWPRLMLVDHEPPAGFAFRRPARVLLGTTGG